MNEVEGGSKVEREFDLIDMMEIEINKNHVMNYGDVEYSTSFLQLESEVNRDFLKMSVYMRKGCTPKSMTALMKLHAGHLDNVSIQLLFDKGRLVHYWDNLTLDEAYQIIAGNGSKYILSHKLPMVDTLDNLFDKQDKEVNLYIVTERLDLVPSFKSMEDYEEIYGGVQNNLTETESAEQLKLESYQDSASYPAETNPDQNEYNNYKRNTRGFDTVDYLELDCDKRGILEYAGYKYKTSIFLRDQHEENKLNIALFIREGSSPSALKEILLCSCNEFENKNIKVQLAFDKSKEVYYWNSLSLEEALRLISANGANATIPNKPPVIDSVYKIADILDLNFDMSLVVERLDLVPAFNRERGYEKECKSVPYSDSNKADTRNSPNDPKVKVVGKSKIDLVPLNSNHYKYYLNGFNQNENGISKKLYSFSNSKRSIKRRLKTMEIVFNKVSPTVFDFKYPLNVGGIP